MQQLQDKLTLAAKHCWQPGARIVVAVSGGPDSQSLLDALALNRVNLGIDALWAVGIDHGLRSSAGAELDLAERLAQRHGIPFERIAVDVSRRGNRLAQARQARYTALESFARAVGADGVALAHTATDQLETILLHLTRGSALRGVAGMRARRGLRLRPLLQVTRAEIMAYAAARHLTYAQDPSNTDPRRARAQLRAEVLPALRALNPHAEEHAARFALRAQSDERALMTQARRALKAARAPGGGIRVGPLARLPDTVALRALRTWLAEHDVRLNAVALAELWESRHTKRHARSAGPVLVSFERQTFWCSRPGGYDEALTIPGERRISDLGVTIRASHVTLADGTPWRFAQSASETVAFDADRLHLGLRIRTWQPGDKLRPLGLQGSMKVGDLFTNEKIPRPLRARWPLLVHGQDVLWVVGLRRGQGAVLNEATRHVLKIELEGAPLWGAC